MNILDFLIDNPVEKAVEEVVISNRIPYKFKIRAITNDEYNTALKRSIKIKSNGERSTDFKKLQDICCMYGTIEPDFANADVVNKTKSIDGIDVMNKLLLPGEKVNLFQAINKLSGFDNDLEEDIEDIKKQ